MTTDYDAFLERKTHRYSECGFDPVFMPPFLFDFQKALVEWAVRKGRAAIFADCGLGKTAMQLVWAQNVVEKTNRRVLLLTPLAVGAQTQKEAEKFGIHAKQSRDGKLESNIVVANYERLHYFNPKDFAGVVCDESSILKNFDGATRAAVTDFMRKTPYRLLCTATAAPNDSIELGTSAEALGYMGAQDMVNMFFRKAKATTTASEERRSGFYILRAHAQKDFWRWVCSWARAVRKPSDLGFQDEGFALPPLNVRQHVVSANRPRDGYLFDLPAVGLKEQRQDLRRTIEERCKMVADLVAGRSCPSLVWCNLNDEGRILSEIIPGSVEVSGADSDEEKEAAFSAFIDGTKKVLITKPDIGGFGLNFQHCDHHTYFPSHSYEQYYQSVRRSWRFGQRNPVTVDLVTTDGQEGVLLNLQRKTEAAERMFSNLVELMGNELKVARANTQTKKEEIPSWL